MRQKKSQQLIANALTIGPHYHRLVANTSTIWVGCSNGSCCILIALSKAKSCVTEGDNSNCINALKDGENGYSVHELKIYCL